MFCFGKSRINENGGKPFNLCCYHGQLAPFPVATCRPLTSLAAKRAKLQSTTLLPLETRNVARGNSVILKKVHNVVTKTPSCLIQLIYMFFCGFIFSATVHDVRAKSSWWRISYSDFSASIPFLLTTNVIKKRTQITNKESRNVLHASYNNLGENTLQTNRWYRWPNTNVQ